MARRLLGSRGCCCCCRRGAAAVVGLATDRSTGCAVAGFTGELHTAVLTEAGRRGQGGGRIDGNRLWLLLGVLVAMVVATACLVVARVAAFSVTPKMEFLFRLEDMLRKALQFSPREPD